MARRSGTGAAGAEIAYASRYYRPALDSWDCGLTTRRDLTIWATHVATGNYHGVSFLRWKKLGPGFTFPYAAIEATDWVARLEQTQP
jgi:hypothetical protein